MSQPEPPADHAAVAKKVSYLVWARAGREVEVFGLTPKHQVSHATTDEIRGVAVPIETANDFGRVRVEKSAWNRVRVDERFGGLLVESASRVVVSLTEARI